MRYSHRERIIAALARCSRDKWLSPDKVQALAFSFAKCISGNWTFSADGALNKLPGCDAVGLLRGQTPFGVGTPAYRDFLVLLKNPRKRKLRTTEEEILRLTLKELTT